MPWPQTGTEALPRARFRFLSGLIPRVRSLASTFSVILCVALSLKMYTKMRVENPLEWVKNEVGEGNSDMMYFRVGQGVSNACDIQ